LDPFAFLLLDALDGLAEQRSARLLVSLLADLDELA
jgi:hypothetical protein